MTNEPDGKRRCERPYGAYSTMKEALEACERDRFCQMVYNENCTDAGEFTLCSKLESSISASVKSCIYTKSIKCVIINTTFPYIKQDFSEVFQINLAFFDRTCSHSIHNRYIYDHNRSVKYPIVNTRFDFWSRINKW